MLFNELHVTGFLGIGIGDDDIEFSGEYFISRHEVFNKVAIIGDLIFVDRFFFVVFCVADIFDIPVDIHFPDTDQNLQFTRKRVEEIFEAVDKYVLFLVAFEFKVDGRRFKDKAVFVIGKDKDAVANFFYCDLSSATNRIRHVRKQHGVLLSYCFCIEVSFFFFS